MGIKTVYTFKALKAIRARTLEGKKNIKKGETFETDSRIADTLKRSYSKYVEVVEINEVKKEERSQEDLGVKNSAAFGQEVGGEEAIKEEGVAQDPGTPEAPTTPEVTPEVKTTPEAPSVTPVEETPAVQAEAPTEVAQAPEVAATPAAPEEEIIEEDEEVIIETPDTVDPILPDPAPKTEEAAVTPEVPAQVETPEAPTVEAAPEAKTTPATDTNVGTNEEVIDTTEETEEDKRERLFNEAMELDIPAVQIPANIGTEKLEAKIAAAKEAKENEGKAAA